MVLALWPRLGRNLQLVLLAAASSPPEGATFTVDDLAQKVGVPYRSLRAKLNGGLARSWTSVARKEVQDAPAIFIKTWAGNHHQLALSAEVRQAVLAQTARP